MAYASNFRNKKKAEDHFTWITPLKYHRYIGLVLA